MTKRRPLALGAAATIGLGSLFIASPAIAEGTETPSTEAVQQEVQLDATDLVPAEPQQAPAEESTEAEGSEDQAPEESETGSDEKASDEAPSEDELESLEVADVEIVATGTNADGELVIVKTADSAEGAAADKAVEVFAAERGVDNPEDIVEVTLPAAPEAWAEGDVVGGQGYAGVRDPYLYACSIGFNAWGPDRKPAFFGAGHCAYDNTNAKLDQTVLTVPSKEPAVDGPGYVLPDPLILLGNFGFAQFGSTGSTPGSNGDTQATDISVIDVNEQGGWNLKPEVTDWTTAGDSTDSLAGSTVKVKRVAEPQAGEVSKSGRTTGFTTGQISSASEHILDGWAQIEDRWVRGFSSDVIAGPGDSGGSVLQGSSAVGLISGGLTAEQNNGEQWTWSARLVNALEFVDGYEVALDIDAPAVTSHSADAVVEPGTTISGSAPSNATEVSVSLQANSGSSVPVSESAFSFTAPDEEGEYTATLTATNGMSRSESTTFSFSVAEAAITAPTIDDVDTDDTSVTVSGTGRPGATVTVSGGASGTATVGDDGKWTLNVELEIGEYEVSAVQEDDGETSSAANGKIIVRPTAPSITSPSDGASIPNAESPSSLSGTGIAGAELTLDDGQGAGAETASLADSKVTVGEDGTWTVDLGEPLATGSYAYTATQQVNGIDSKATTVAFTVESAEVPPAPKPGPDPDPEPKPTPDPTPAPTTPNDTQDGLATTGIDLLPYGLTAGAMLLIGGAAIALVARRQRQEEM